MALGNLPEFSFPSACKGAPRSRQPCPGSSEGTAVSRGARTAVSRAAPSGQPCPGSSEGTAVSGELGQPCPGELGALPRDARAQAAPFPPQPALGGAPRPRTARGTLDGGQGAALALGTGSRASRGVWSRATGDPGVGMGVRVSVKRTPQPKPRSTDGINPVPAQTALPPHPPQSVFPNNHVLLPYQKCKRPFSVPIEKLEESRAMRTQAGQHLCKEAGLATGPVAVPVEGDREIPHTPPRDSPKSQKKQLYHKAGRNKDSESASPQGSRRVGAACGGGMAGAAQHSALPGTYGDVSDPGRESSGWAVRPLSPSSRQPVARGDNEHRPRSAVPAPVPASPARGPRVPQSRSALPCPRSFPAAMPCPASHGKTSEIIFSDQEVRLRLKEEDGEPSVCPGGSPG
ncbi:skin secretory protein xP2-like [Molothrus ater]|uniref:skin secretory protein xP2-like n=1 Tax=Molothrus ater TaxID=84834 RepID=UPI0017492CCD|nr:skin secretory protein xP2-like [Molothrus ater]